MITDSSDVKPKSFYTNSYLQICSTSTKVELIPSVIFVYVLRSLLEALERAKSNIQRSTLPALRDCVTPEALTQMALLPQESQRVQRPRGPQSTGLLKASPVASVVFLFLRCCLGNWGCIYSEILLYIHCLLNAIGQIRKFVAKMLHEAQLYQENCIIKFTSWTSLVVWWIRLHLPMQGTQVPSLVRGDPTCLRATQPVCHSYWAHEPRAPCSATGKATALKSLSSPQLEKAQVQQWRCSMAEKKTISSFKKIDPCKDAW